jgi:hypothetical protein
MRPHVYLRKRLVAEGKLIRVDREGRKLDSDEKGGGQAISILGPIPLPLQLGGLRLRVTWYACVRNTELSKVQELADQLRAQHTQSLFANLASSMAVNCVLVIGDPDKWTNPLIRVHSSCLTGDVFGSERCECGPQLQHARRRAGWNGRVHVRARRSRHRVVGQSGDLPVAGCGREYLPG